MSEEQVGVRVFETISLKIYGPEYAPVIVIGEKTCMCICWHLSYKFPSLPIVPFALSLILYSFIIPSGANVFFQNLKASLYSGKTNNLKQ